MIRTTIDGEEMAFETAPGLFSPERIDPGTAAMLALVRFQPGDRVLDLGCGYGVVGVLAALKAGAEAVVMADVDPAAVAIARKNAKLNGVERVTAVVSDGLASVAETGFTKILSNPPYHADFAVPKAFIEKGFNRLALEGTMWMVTKRRDWYRNKLTAIFGGVKVHAADDYWVFEAQKRQATYANRRR